MLIVSYGMFRYGSIMGSSSTLLLAALLIMVLGIIAQAKVKSTFNKYNSYPVSCGKTAASIASELLYRNGSNVRVQQISGTLTDNYNPKAGCVSLSQSVYSSTSIAAVAVAAHECGHVMQYESGYNAIKLRNSILPVANIGARFSFLLVIIGLFMGSLGYTVSMVGVVLFGFVLAFQLLTLPIELNASRRALDMLTAGGYISGAEEEGYAKKVLRAAAFTYVVAVLSAAISFLRLLAIANSTRRR